MTKTILKLTIWLLIIIIAPAFCYGQSFPITNYDYYRISNGLSPAVAAIGGINLTNTSFTNTSYYNPSLLAFRKTSTVSSTFRVYHEKETPLDNLDLPARGSFLWNSNSMAYFGIEAENVSFNYLSLAHTDYNYADADYNNYLNYYLDGYRFSYGSASNLLAFGLNTTFYSGRAVYLRQEIAADINIVDNFLDERALGYGLDFGAVYKTDSFAYGFFIPNLISRIYWSNNSNASLRRRFHSGFQYGSDDSFIVTGFSRKFDFKSSNTYHIGLQQNVTFGGIRGAGYTVPLRLGAYSNEPFWKLKELKYGFGTGIQYSYFMIDISMNTEDHKWDNYYIMTSISVNLDQ